MSDRRLRENRKIFTHGIDKLLRARKNEQFRERVHDALCEFQSVPPNERNADDAD